MSKMKRVVCFAVMACLTLSLSLTGCGSNSAAEDQEKSSGSVSDGTGTTVEKLEPVELTWYNIGNGQPKDADSVNEKISEYLKDKINASLKITTYDWNSYDTKMSAMMAAGESFDIVFTCSWAFPYRLNATKGALVELDGMLDKYAPKTKEILGKEFLDASRVNGKLYALPVNKEKAHSWGVLMRKDLVDKYKFDVSTVKKIEDMEPFLKAVKENEKGVYPLQIGNRGGTLNETMNWDYISGHEFVPGVLYGDNRDSKVVNQYETPEYLAYFKQLRKWYLSGYVRKDAAIAKDTKPTNESGEYAVLPNQLKPGKDAEMSNKNFQWVQVEMTPVTMSISDTGGSMQGISTTSKNPERALMLLELMYTDKTLLNMVDYGIEGTHYKKVSDNAIEVAKDSPYTYDGSQWQFGNQFLSYLKQNEDSDKWKKFEDFNKSAQPMKSLGFSFNPESVKTEQAALETVCLEFLPLLNTGAGDPDTVLPKFTAKLKKAGLERYMAELQKQYDEFLKSK